MQSLFDETWIYQTDKLARVNNANLIVPCIGGLVRCSAGVGQVDYVDTVMRELGFDRVGGRSSLGYLVFRDRLKRRLDDEIKFGFRYPPIGLDWHVIRSLVDRWWLETPNNDNLQDIPWQTRP